MMHKWALPLLLVATLFLPTAGQAQEAITLSSMQIQIWPEFDQPSVLVIYQMTLAPDTTFPATVSVRIPIAAGDPNAVAVRQVDGSLYTTDYTPQVSGNWTVITFTTTAAEIQLEYYDPELIKEDDSRHFVYTWPGDYAIADLSIQVQQPLDATNMRISPSFGSGATGNDNLTYYTQDIGTISAGQSIRVTMDYDKSTDTLSAENLPVQPSGTIPQSTVPNLNVATWLPYILGILGAGLIIGGIIWFWRSGRQKPLQQPRRRRSKPAPDTRQEQSGSGESGIYCSRCGKRASPGDLFCRSCGTPIRSK